VAVVVISESGSETIGRRRFNQILWARRAGKAIEQRADRSKWEKCDGGHILRTAVAAKMSGIGSYQAAAFRRRR
jgi:hypothetical protein